MISIEHTLLKLGYFQAHPGNLCVISLHTSGFLAKPTLLGPFMGRGVQAAILSYEWLCFLQNW